MKMAAINKKDLAKMIDQTLLSPWATAEQVKTFCGQAAEYGFASVCINPVFVQLASSALKDSSVKVCTVIDFPLGAGGTQTKILQAQDAIKSGADELDFVIDLSLVKGEKWDQLVQQLSLVTEAVRGASEEVTSINPKRPKLIEKLILETCFLNDREIIKSCLCAKQAGFDFVKTSTGFAIQKDKDGKLLPNGATVHAVALMRDTVGPEMGVKASGGIHSAAQALELIKAGASRIGASAGTEIVDQLDS